MRTSPSSTPAWADESRRARHPDAGDPDRFAEWRTGAVDRLRELLALPADTADHTGDHLITGRVGAVAGTARDETVRLVTLTTDGTEIPCWLLLRTRRATNCAIAPRYAPILAPPTLLLCTLPQQASDSQRAA